MIHRSALLDEFQQLGTSADPHARGLRLEGLLERAFQRAHFKVVRNPRIARPRQTDLAATYGPDRYLIEAKWEKAPLGSDGTDSLCARLRRTENSVIGVIFSVAGYTKEARDEVIQRRGEHTILLFGASEIEKTLEDPAALLRLLRFKREQLVVEARVHLAGEKLPRRSPRPAAVLPGTDVRLLDLDLGPRSSVPSPGGFQPFVFVQDLPDVDWTPGGGTGVCLDLPISAFDENGVVDLLHELYRMGWTTERPCWNIQQISRNWHGLGTRQFVETLRDWEARAASVESAHHSEEFFYYDTCDGGFYTITASVTCDEYRRTTRCNVSFQLSGIPVDPEPIKHLFDKFETLHAGRYRSLNRKAMSRSRAPENMNLKVLGYVVTPDDLNEGEEEWVTGLVAENPCRTWPGGPPVGWPAGLAESDLIICSLHSHHRMSEPRDSYHLKFWEKARTSDASALCLIADW